MNTDKTTTEKFANVLGQRMFYRHAGQSRGEAVLLLHGFPTSSYLWRKVIPELATDHEVWAPDLLGFGKSDKPQELSYSLGCHAKYLDAFVSTTGVSKVHLVVHDLGGPVGLLWATTHREKVASITILNTVVHPDISLRLRTFIGLWMIPGVRAWMVSPSGIALTMRLGVKDQSLMDQQVLTEYQAPFQDGPSRRVLLKQFSSLDFRQMRKAVDGLRELSVPIQVFYGTDDRLLPGVKVELERLKEAKEDLAMTPIPGCGHFLQEERPRLLAEKIRATALRAA